MRPVALSGAPAPSGYASRSASAISSEAWYRTAAWSGSRPSASNAAAAPGSARSSAATVPGCCVALCRGTSPRALRVCEAAGHAAWSASTTSKSHGSDAQQWRGVSPSESCAAAAPGAAASSARTVSAEGLSHRHAWWSGVFPCRSAAAAAAGWRSRSRATAAALPLAAAVWSGVEPHGCATSCAASGNRSRMKSATAAG